MWFHLVSFVNPIQGRASSSGESKSQNELKSAEKNWQELERAKRSYNELNQEIKEAPN